ncbi:hypothetical protein E2562_008107 [Oryza meyeriana var. granulata]|uniref:Uncharacterized protein n=1 Tax=Oryza meyeriana var. granulata TaxID=110450 RepID=A0A6G1CEC3_9ORYZ|nr:hypothetical protein E2562_008107 [Oryza meyeriana var. granulata]
MRGPDGELTGDGQMAAARRGKAEAGRQSSSRRGQRSGARAVPEHNGDGADWPPGDTAVGLTLRQCSVM